MGKSLFEKKKKNQQKKFALNRTEHYHSQQSVSSWWSNMAAHTELVQSCSKTWSVEACWPSLVRLNNSLLCFVTHSIWRTNPCECNYQYRRRIDSSRTNKLIINKTAASSWLNDVHWLKENYEGKSHQWWRTCITAHAKHLANMTEKGKSQWIIAVQSLLFIFFNCNHDNYNLLKTVYSGGFVCISSCFNTWLTSKLFV